MKHRIEELVVRYALPAASADRLEAILGALATEPTSVTAVRDPAKGAEIHVADALAGLAVPALREASRIADIGSGSGIPGLVLAVALPEARITLVESVSKKCDFLARAAAAAAVVNVDVVNCRAEAWPAGLAAHDAVTARALAPLPVLLEYAAPLLRVGGTLVAWKGHRDPGEERDGAEAAARLGMTGPEPRRAEPIAGADRHLYVSAKLEATPNRFPRRPGMARKRPIRAKPGR